MGLEVTPAAVGGRTAGDGREELLFDAVERGHLGIEVVEVVDGEGLRSLRLLQRAVFEFPMMAGDDVLDLQESRRGEAGHLPRMAVDQQHTESDMAEELADVRVAEVACEAELLELADVVQDAAGDEDIAVEAIVTISDSVRELDERQDVVEETADIGVVQALAGRTVCQPEKDLRIVDEPREERADMVVIDRGDNPAQFRLHLREIAGDHRQELVVVDHRRVDPLERVDDELQVALKLLDPAAHAQKIIDVEGVVENLVSFPADRADGTRAIS